MGNNTWPYLIKILLGVFLSYLFYYYVILEFDFNIDALFKYYLKGCYWVCIIAIIQLISFKINFTPGYDYTWILNKTGPIIGGNLGIRLNSVFGEPTYFAMFISSAVFVAIYDLISRNPYYYKKTQALLIIMASILSFSGAGYIGYFIAIILLLVNYGFLKLIFLSSVIIPISFYLLYNNVYEFKSRFDSTYQLFFLDDGFEIGKTHGSSIVLYNNYHVAKENFKENFLGTGLGSHAVAFEKYSLTKSIETKGFANNNLDGNSMFNRLLSETGVVGIILFLLIIVKKHIKRSINDPFDERWIISNAILVMILTYMFRQGHYFLNGFAFFIWMYYYLPDVKSSKK